MKSLKFSILLGFFTWLLYMMMDVVGTFLALVTGFVNMPADALNPLYGGMDYLLKISDKNYWISFIIGFLVGFPVYFIKEKINIWAKRTEEDNQKGEII